jgi:dihydroorotase-like cyclic amidohydrolase
MKYLLLKNGQISSHQKIISGDILIGNNRIIEVGSNIQVPSTCTIVQDVSNKYLLPGLIHYDCPILKTDDKEQNSSSIYMALSHGATFLMDTIRLKKEADFREAIGQARESCKPIITDYGFHLGSSTCARVSIQDLNYGFIHEGITSYYIKWKHIEKIKEGQLDHLLSLAAKFQLLIICETNSIKQSLMAHKPEFVKIYLKKMQQLASILNNTGCPFLFLDLTLEEELETLYATWVPGQPVYASVSLDFSNNVIPGRLTISNLEKLWENPNILLAPPNMNNPDPEISRYIEHGKSPSFLLDIFSDYDDVSPSLLTKVCDMYAKRPAQLFGIYPQKGVIEPGADADIIIWNPTEPDRSKTGGSNTSLLRKDISALIVNGQVITDDQLKAPNHLNGKFIQRNSPIPTKSMIAHDLA